ncbi:hypothetical protein MMC16_004516 [Acarospora aff. strigata]|nr:hypothetical protein [Acarospora aff. strigata]
MQQSSFRSLGTIGTVNDQHVEFTYLNEHDGKLSWQIVETGEGNGLQSQSVIVIIRGVAFESTSHDHSTHNPALDSVYTILHMRTNERDLNEGGSNFSVEFTKATNLPTAFLDKHLISACPAILCPEKTQDHLVNVHIIISKGSGTGLAQSFFTDVLRPTLSALGLSEESYQVHETHSDQTITELTRSVFMPRANQGIRQIILLLSGDGGIVDMINVLLSSSISAVYVKPTLGLLALGTGNALAYSTNPPQDSTFGLASIIKGTLHPLPTFMARFSAGSVQLLDGGKRSEPLVQALTGGDYSGLMYGAVVCSWGLHASLVADSDTPEYRKYGVERFNMAAKELLWPTDGSPPHRYRGEISLLKSTSDGSEVWEPLCRQEHMYILATLVSNLQKALTISPFSKPLDGRLRLIHFGPVESEEVMQIMAKAQQGGLHVEEDAVAYEDINGLRIKFAEGDSRWRRVCVDGRIVTVNKGGWVEVRRESRDVLDVIARV